MKKIQKIQNKTIGRKRKWKWKRKIGYKHLQEVIEIMLNWRKNKKLKKKEKEREGEWGR